MPSKLQQLHSSSSSSGGGSSVANYPSLRMTLPIVPVRMLTLNYRCMSIVCMSSYVLSSLSHLDRSRHILTLLILKRCLNSTTAMCIAIDFFDSGPPHRTAPQVSKARHIIKRQHTTSNVKKQGIEAHKVLEKRYRDGEHVKAREQ